jgi:hypothetical protein
MPSYASQDVRALSCHAQGPRGGGRRFTNAFLADFQSSPAVQVSAMPRPLTQEQRDRRQWQSSARITLLPRVNLDRRAWMTVASTIYPSMVR